MRLFRHKRALFSWGVLFVVLLTGGVLLSQPLLRIEQISCQVEQTACPDYVTAELRSHLGKSIFSSDVLGSAQRITQVLPSLKNPQVRRELPKTVVVQFASSPASYVLLSEDKTPWIVDTSGVVIHAEPRSDLLQVKVPASLFESVALRTAIDPELHQAMQTIVQMAPSFPNSVVSVEVKNRQEVALHLSDARTAIVEPSQIDQQLQKLHFVLETVEFSQFSPPIRTIDLRFKYPILQI